jgi:hypothetical protein
MFLNWIANGILVYSKRRFRIYRILEHHPMSDSRWLIVESIKRKRFLEVGFDEFPILEDYVDAEGAKELREMTDLADILMAIERLRFDVMFYRREWDLRGEKSIAAVIERAAIARREFWERFREQMATATLDPENPSRLILEPEGLVEPQSKIARKKGFHAHFEVSSDDRSIEDCSQHLRAEIVSKAKAKRVYWKSVETTPQGQECQVLTFEG